MESQTNESCQGKFAGIHGFGDKGPSQLHRQRRSPCRGLNAPPALEQTPGLTQLASDLWPEEVKSREPIRYKREGLSTDPLPFYPVTQNTVQILKILLSF